MNIKFAGKYSNARKKYANIFMNTLLKMQFCLLYIAKAKKIWYNIYGISLFDILQFRILKINIKRRLK